MKIKEIGIDGFGKFHDYHTELSEGIQVIYGNNETGKTTLRQFMFHMLFGLERPYRKRRRGGIYAGGRRQIWRISAG